MAAVASPARARRQHLPELEPLEPLTLADVATDALPDLARAILAQTIRDLCSPADATDAYEWLHSDDDPDATWRETVVYLADVHLDGLRRLVATAVIVDANGAVTVRDRPRLKSAVNALYFRREHRAEPHADTIGDGHRRRVRRHGMY